MKQNGFSLMELIIVIVIMGLLVGAMIPMFAKNTEKARIAKAQEELEAIKKAVLMFYADTGTWPIFGGTGWGLVENNPATPNWAGPYLSEWKKDPWNNSYMISHYFDAFNNEGVWVYSYGPNNDWDACAEGKDDICVTITPQK